MTFSFIDQELKKQALIGMIRAVPIILGYLPIGLAFGILASTAGLSTTAAAAMSVFVFAGSSQLISVGLIGAGVGVFSITVTVFLVNLRHMLMSAYLAPHMRKLKLWQLVLFSYEITDESFAMHSAYIRKKGVPPAAELFALNISAHLAWVAGSVLGAWLGSSITLDIAALGIDFALPAMFIALMVIQVESIRHLAVALFAALMGLLFFLAGMNQLYIILATVTAATVGVLTERKSNQVEEDKLV